MEDDYLEGLRLLIGTALVMFSPGCCIDRTSIFEQCSAIGFSSAEMA